MVKALTKTNRHAVAGAVTEAEKSTSTKLAVVVAPASDAYHSYCMLYGLCLGSVISMALWMEKLTTDFPLLLLIQLAAIALLSLTPARHLCVRLVPKRVRHHRAAHRAYEEYMIASRHHVSPATPLVLLYVSLAERYAHILTSRSVHEKIPDSEWNAVIAEFTSVMSKEGLESACINATQHAAKLLTPHFPKSN
jgi:putative membrane protein